MTVRLFRISCICMAFLVASGCDSINEKISDAVPDIAISGGVFGLNGAAGAEATGTFSDAGKTSAIEAVATLGLGSTFDDLEAGDFSEISALGTTIGLAILTGNVGMTLHRGGGALLPNTIQVTGWSLNWLISDATHTGVTALGTPSGSPVTSAVPNTFTRVFGCLETAASCGYTASNSAALLTLFPMEVTQEAYLTRLSEVVMKPTGGTNSPNTIALTLQVTVTNTAADLAGISATMWVAEYETTVTPILF